MRKLAVMASFALLSISSFATEPVAVTEKVLHAFQQSFKNVINPVWHENANHYEVRFLENSITTQISYSKDGNVLHIKRYYTEENLPLFIREKLHREYPDTKISGVTEISNAHQMNYSILLETTTTWTFVNSSADGAMEVYKKFKKA